MYDYLWTGALTDFLAQAVVAQANPPTGVTVDFGCGTGLVSQTLVQSGHSVVGIDSSAAMLRRFAARLPETPVILGSVDDPPLRRHSVNTVVATNVLHLHPRPIRTLGRLVELLKPAGLIICSWPRDDAGPRRIALAELRAGVGASTVAARTCGRIAMALIASRSSQRNSANSLMRSIVDFARLRGFALTSFDLPSAQQTLVVLRGM